MLFQTFNLILATKPDQIHFCHVTQSMTTLTRTSRTSRIIFLVKLLKALRKTTNILVQEVRFPVSIWMCRRQMFVVTRTICCRFTTHPPWAGDSPHPCNPPHELTRRVRMSGPCTTPPGAQAVMMRPPGSSEKHQELDWRHPSHGWSL